MENVASKSLCPVAKEIASAKSVRSSSVKCSSIEGLFAFDARKCRPVAICIWIGGLEIHFPLQSGAGNAPGKFPQGFVRERKIRQACLPLQGFSRIQQFVESDGKFSVHWHSFCLKVEPRDERATTS